MARSRAHHGYDTSLRRAPLKIEEPLCHQVRTCGSRGHGRGTEPAHAGAAADYLGQLDARRHAQFS